MSDNEMLYCLIAFILGWLASRMMGNGFSVGAGREQCKPLDHRATVDQCKAIGDDDERSCNMYRNKNSQQECYWQHDTTPPPPLPPPPPPRGNQDKLDAIEAQTKGEYHIGDKHGWKCIKKGSKKGCTPEDNYKSCDATKNICVQGDYVGDPLALYLTQQKCELSTCSVTDAIKEQFGKLQTNIKIAHMRRQGAPPELSRAMGVPCCKPESPPPASWQKCLNELDKNCKDHGGKGMQKCMPCVKDNALELVTAGCKSEILNKWCARSDDTSCVKCG